MGLKSIFFSAKPAESRPNLRQTDYIDLEAYAEGSELFDGTASMMVRVAELHRYEDLREYANDVYRGNMVLLDFSAIANDDIILRRVTNDLKKLVADINGDIAGLGKTMLIITPTGVKVDRRKQRGSKF